MFAETNVQLLEPNVLYLDEKPPKIVKTAKGAKRVAKKKYDKVEKKRKTKTAKRPPVSVKLSLKKESQSFLNEKSNSVREEIDDSILVIDDPLHTTDNPIKMEIDGEDGRESEHKKKECLRSVQKKPSDVDDNCSLEAEELCEVKLEDVDEDNDQAVDSNDDEIYDEDDDDDDDEEEEDYKDSDDEYEDEDDDDEPLIMIAKRKGRPPRKKRIPRSIQCRDLCKPKCTEKLNEEQRRIICDLFWSMSDEDKKLYIRQHTRIRPKRYQRKKSKTNAPHFSFFLDNVSSTTAAAAADNNEEDENDKPQLIKVCRRYFESTLRASDYTVKRALEGYQPEVEVVPKPPSKSKKLNSNGEKKEVEDVVQQLLDPETGNLVTIDPKATPKPKAKGKRKPGDPMPEHNPKPVKCEERCIFKCHTQFTEEERKQICDIFWSLDYNRRKDFILARIETKDIEALTTPEFRTTDRPPRTYHTRFFLRSASKGENIRVCKHFMMNTLSISKMFIRNAIAFADKTTGHYTGLDRRGLNSYKIAPDHMQFIKDHIGSYPTWIPYKKSKIRYLHYTLSIKRMHTQYKELCITKQMKFASTSIYYRSFHDDFHLLFLSNPHRKSDGILKANPNVSHYTGEEPGGMWFDPKGEPLDFGLYDPGKSFMTYTSSQQPHQPQREQQQMATTSSSVHEETFPISPESSAQHSTNAATPQQTVTTAQTSSISSQSQSSFGFNQSTFNYAHLIDPSLSSNILYQQTVVATPSIQNEFNLNLYENRNVVPHAHAASTSSLFKKP